uniref:Uncharacterized protein n=1 Tax=viral metagenome TaxID=1070528 RepID=A0A6C0K2E7_9ZZZZ
MSSRIINFKESDIPPKLPDSLKGRTDLTMILWAGDCVQNGITDVLRLPIYNIYVCNDVLKGGLELNAYELETKRMPGYICLIDVSDKIQMDMFIDLFGGCISLIDSDYHGNTPSLELNQYSDLLRGDGIAYHVEGINTAYYPTVELAYALEVFAPILSPENNYVRMWSKPIRDLAKFNDLTSAEVWTSPDLRGLEYDSVYQEQNKYRDFMLKINPNAMFAFTYTDKLEEYWDTLSTQIISVDILRVYNTWKEILTPQKDDKGYKDRFMAYLKGRCESGLRAQSQSLSDFETYCSKFTDSIELVRVYQKTLIHLELAKEASAHPLLYGRLTNFIDKRLVGKDVEEYGVVISKV